MLSICVKNNFDVPRPFCLPASDKLPTVHTDRVPSWRLRLAHNMKCDCRVAPGPGGWSVPLCGSIIVSVASMRAQTSVCWDQKHNRDLPPPPPTHMMTNMQELRIAKDAQQHQPGTEHSNAKNGHPRGDEDDGDRDEPPQEQGGSSGSEEERAALKEEARQLRDELAAVKAHAEVCSRKFRANLDLALRVYVDACVFVCVEGFGRGGPYFETGAITKAWRSLFLFNCPQPRVHRGASRGFTLFGCVEALLAGSTPFSRFHLVRVTTSR